MSSIELQYSAKGGSVTRRKRLRILDGGSALMWALAWVVVAYSLATPVAAIAAAVTSMVAFFIGRNLSATNVRTPSVVLLAAITGPILVALARWPSRSPLAASLFPTPEALMLFTDFLVWGLMAALVVATLQFLSNRYQAFVSLEVIVVALFLATPFAAHRDGFINRPYFLIDPLWSRGHDPVPILQALGVVIAVALILLTIGRATERSSIFDLVILCMLAFGLYLYIPQDVIKDMVSDPPGNSGLTGKPEEAKPRDGQGGPGSQPMSGDAGGSSNAEPFPFETSADKPKPKPVAVVVFRDDYDSPDGYYYFRQTAFSQFNGFRVVKDTTGKADSDLFKRFPTKVETAEAPPPRLDIPSRKLETRVALISSHTEPFGLVAPLEMKPASNPNPDQFERAYDVVSLVYGGDYTELLASNLESPTWTPEMKAHYLGYPDKDPRYKKLADEIVAKVDPDYRQYTLAKALAITLHLGENGKYTTKRRPVGESEDPTADFLFGDMTGYCVHFSHSAVYLMRAAGIPARVGAGYAVEGRNRRGSALLILSSAAHAWPEVWINGLGWYPLDVAPAVNLDTPEPPPDFDLQAMLAEMAREEGEPYEQPKEFDLRQFLKMLMGMVWSFLPWLVGAALFAAYGLKIERRLAPYFEKDEQQKINALYRAALDRVGEAGYLRKFGQGRLAFSQEHKDTVPSLLPLTKAHLAQTMGKKGNQAPLERYDLAQLQKSYQDLGGDLARCTPAWRRLLGVLNPLSWLMTR
jgi:transglutaminase-like putative cysteine protease